MSRTGRGKRSKQHESSVVPFGASIERFTAEVGIPRRTYFLLPEEAKPHRVQIGRRTIITEKAPEWLERMRAAGGVVMLKRPDLSRAA